MENLERFGGNLAALFGEENVEQFQDFFRVQSVGRDLALALATLGLVFIQLYRIPHLGTIIKDFLRTISVTKLEDQSTEFMKTFQSWHSNAHKKYLIGLLDRKQNSTCRTGSRSRQGRSLLDYEIPIRTIRQRSKSLYFSNRKTFWYQH